jgi:hypothetical protein
MAVQFSQPRGVTPLEPIVAAGRCSAEVSQSVARKLLHLHADPEWPDVDSTWPWLGRRSIVPTLARPPPRRLRGLERSSLLRGLVPPSANHLVLPDEWHVEGRNYAIRSRRTR